MWHVVNHVLNHLLVTVLKIEEDWTERKSREEIREIHVCVCVVAFPATSACLWFTGEVVSHVMTVLKIQEGWKTEN